MLWGIWVRKEKEINNSRVRKGRGRLGEIVMGEWTEREVRGKVRKGKESKGGKGNCTLKVINDNGELKGDKKSKTEIKEREKSHLV